MKREIKAMFGRADATTGGALARRVRRLSALERSEEARAFLDAYHDAAGHGGALRQRRWAEVRRDLRKRGHYDHNPGELAFGARLAWRNTGRCIGRLPWESLEVADCREIADPDAIAARMSDHLREADSGGGIRSLISVFAPVKGTDLPAWIESSQIVRYACHHLSDGTIIGDRQNADATRLARSMGWQPDDERGAFDLLPYFVRDSKDRRIMIEPPRDRIREIDIEHPLRSGLSTLGLRWYAVPLVSDMILTIGGID